MDKKTYMSPVSEVIEIKAPVIMAGSPGGGINSDYSTGW